MSFPSYPRYKDSELEWLGQIPEHWEFRPLRHLAQLESGHTPSRQRADYWIEEDCVIPWFTLADVGFLRDGRNTTIERTSQKISPIGIENSAARLLPPGTVLLSRTASVGFSGITNIPLAVSQDFAAWICGPDLMPHYLLYCLRAMKPEFQRLMMGSTHKTIYMPDIEAFRVPVPPIIEQNGIVEFLDQETTKIDELVAEQQRLMDLLKEKRQTVISHAVTKGLNPSAPMKASGIEWLGDVPAHWEVKRLKYVSPQITVGIVVEPSKFYTVEGVPALRSLNVTPGAVIQENLVRISDEANELHAKSKLRAGDLVAVRSGQPGTTTVIPPELDGCNCIDLIIIRKPTIGSEWFLCWYLASDVAVMQFSIGSGGAIQQHFNVSTAMDLIIPMPPAEEQQSIVAFINDQVGELDTLTAEAQRAIELLQERRTALISAAVTGQIDVRGLAKSEAA